MDGQELTRELRQGTLFSGERLPTPEQCGLQRCAYEHAEREELAGVQRLGDVLDALMLIIRARVERRRRARDGEEKSQ